MPTARDKPTKRAAVTPPTVRKSPRKKRNTQPFDPSNGGTETAAPEVSTPTHGLMVQTPVAATVAKDDTSSVSSTSSQTPVVLKSPQQK